MRYQTEDRSNPGTIGSPSEALCVTGKREVGDCGVYANISNYLSGSNI
jgi:hypothetical protein